MSVLWHKRSRNGLGDRMSGLKLGFITLDLLFILPLKITILPLFFYFIKDQYRYQFDIYCLEKFGIAEAPIIRTTLQGFLWRTR